MGKIPKQYSGLGHHWFIEQLKKVESPSILEIGSRRIPGNASNLHKDWAPHAAEFIGTDFMEGDDVDVLADLHTLSMTFGTDRFDGVISCSTMEHVQFPWIAAVEIARVMKPGGVLFVQTHHTYPYHNFPADYWRFTEDGLATLFNPQIGFQVVSTASDIPCVIDSDRDKNLKHYPSYLNVLLIAKKIATPNSGHLWRPE